MLLHLLNYLRFKSNMSSSDDLHVQTFGSAGIKTMTLAHILLDGVCAVCARVLKV